MDSDIAAWMECVTVNIMWKILHSRWTVVLQLQWSVLQWPLQGTHFTTSGQWYCSLNEVCYSDHYKEHISQEVDSDIAAWMVCLKWTLPGRYFTSSGHWYCSFNEVCYSEIYIEDTLQQVDSNIAAWMEFVTVTIIRKTLQSRWTVILQIEDFILLLALFGIAWNPIKATCYAMCNIVTYLIVSERIGTNSFR